MYFVVIYLLFILSFLIVSHRSISILNFPAGASLQLVPNSEFTILSPSHLSHLSHNCPYIPSPLSLLSLPIPPTSPILPTRPTCPTCPTCLTRPSCPTIQNSKFIICQFPLHYLKHFIGLKNAYLYNG